MRNALLVVVGFLLVAVARAADKPILKFDDKRAQEIAVAAIRERYPEIRTEDMSYKGWSADSKTNEPATVVITFLLDKPTVQVEKEDEKERNTRSKQTTINVILSVNGEVKNVSKGEAMVFESKSKRKAIGQPPPGN